MTRTLAIVTAVVVALCANATNAHAYGTGFVYGRLMFYNVQGNFCPDSRAPCTGAKYTQAEWMTNLGVPDSKVYLRNMSGQIIGQGVTDAAGNYTIQWFDPYSGPVTQAYLTWHLDHKDGRFIVHQANGDAFWFQTAPTWVGPTAWLGYATYGGPGAPSGPANLYHGAWRSWHDSLSQSNRLVSYFSGVDIRFAAGECSTSCANAILNRIWMNPGAETSPQARILHEMGHIASVKSSSGHERLQLFNAYDYPYNGGQAGGWNLDEPEWGATTFEEAFATFFADAALYYPTATQPHTCYGDVACSPGQFNLEDSKGSACTTDDARRAINNDRYLWDLYDYNQDYYGENIALSVGYLADVNAYLPDGYDNGGKNEPFYWFWIDDLDGRSLRDFHTALLLSSGYDAWAQAAFNCGMVGD